MPPGQHLPGLGTGHMPELKRAADPARGEPLYRQRLRDLPQQRRIRPSATASADPTSAIVVPPLWGPDTFNDGAGMARLITFANFIHFNMPHGTDYLDAASVSTTHGTSQPMSCRIRGPTSPGIAHDFPDLLLKPVDAPYGPYADYFSERQHKYGPFAPIRREIERLKHAAGVH